jgi:hypothetical protein
MRQLVTRLTMLVPLLMAAGILDTSSAYGVTVGVDGAAIVGSGTISPGLTTVDTSQSVSFTSLVGVGGGAAANSSPAAAAAGPLVSCSFTGSGHGTVAMGSGTATGTCTASPVIPGVIGSGLINCTLTFNQVGAIVVVQGVNSCSAQAGSVALTSPTTVSAGVFLFIPTNNNPVTQYLLAGGAAGAGLNTP